MHIRAKYLLITLGVFIAEILVATKFSDTEFIRSYLSDFLVVILIFCLVKSFWDVPSLLLSISVFLFACGVEILQYLHIVEALGLRRDSLLGILIGNSFSWMDILMYFGGCLTSYFTSAFLLCKPALKNESKSIKEKK